MKFIYKIYRFHERNLLHLRDGELGFRDLKLFNQALLAR